MRKVLSEKAERAFKRIDAAKEGKGAFAILLGCFALFSAAKAIGGWANAPSYRADLRSNAIAWAQACTTTLIFLWFYLNREEAS